LAGKHTTFEKGKNYRKQTEAARGKKGGRLDIKALEGGVSIGERLERKKRGYRNSSLFQFGERAWGRQTLVPERVITGMFTWHELCEGERDLPKGRIEFHDERGGAKADRETRTDN